MFRFRLAHFPGLALLVALAACQPAPVSPSSTSVVSSGAASMPELVIAATDTSVLPPVSPTVTPTASIASTVAPTSATTVPVMPADPNVAVPATVLAEWQLSMPEGLAFGFGSAWVPGHRSQETVRIDSVSNQIAARVEETGFRAHQAIVTADAVWVSGERDDAAMINPSTNAVELTVPGAHPFLAAGFGSIWGTTALDTLDRLDPATGKLLASIKLTDDNRVDCNNFVLTTSAAVFVDVCDDQTWVRIDPATNSIVARMKYETLIDQAKARNGGPAGKGTDFIWTALPDGLLRMDPQTGEGLTFLPLKPEQNSSVGFPPGVTDDSVWVGGQKQFERVDVATNRIVATYNTGIAGEARIGVGFGSVWVAYEERNLVRRFDIAP